MDDKCLMEGLLLLEKGGCDLYMHGAIESSTPNVHQEFKNAFDESLAMQDSIYAAMEKKGWYTMENAEQTKIEAAKTKFSTVMA